MELDKSEQEYKTGEEIEGYIRLPYKSQISGMSVIMGGKSLSHFSVSQVVINNTYNPKCAQEYKPSSIWTSEEWEQILIRSRALL